jgi:glycosyltransferase involved in cell wall biosynthesis
MSGTDESEVEHGPYFSVLVPSYNRPEYITQCVESILASEFDDYEIVISDDRSPRANEIEKVVEPFLSLPNFRFFKQSTNLGEPGSRNFLVAQARGQYNIILGDDDEFFPHTLGTIKAFIDEHPGYDLYALGYRVIDETGRQQYARFAPRTLEVTPAQPRLVEEVLLADLFPFWLYHPATFCCRRGVELAIPYSRRAGIGDDFLFMVDFLNAEKRLIVVPEVLFSWRKVSRPQPKGQINQSFENIANLKARRNIYYVLKERTDLQPSFQRFVVTAAFRGRFLYDPIVADEALSAADLDALKLATADIVELGQHREAAGPLLRLRLLAGRVVRFVRLFGLPGLLCVLNVALQRVSYALRS